MRLEYLERRKLAGKQSNSHSLSLSLLLAPSNSISLARALLSWSMSIAISISIAIGRSDPKRSAERLASNELSFRGSLYHSQSSAMINARTSTMNRRRTYSSGRPMRSPAKPMGRSRDDRLGRANAVQRRRCCVGALIHANTARAATALASVTVQLSTQRRRQLPSSRA